ncbi:MAG: S8 family serine peptidase [Pelistega sp.]|nr:S8 family serine peptidase [Pelistega sp.]
MKTVTRHLYILLPLVFSCQTAYAQAFVEDDEYNRQWGLAAINAAPAYHAGFTGKGITVAVIDSGLDRYHPEFKNKILPGSANFVFDGPDGQAKDDFSDTSLDDNGEIIGHGTHVSGTIAAARDGVAIHGVAYNANILALRTIVSNMTTKDEVAAIYSAIKQGAQVLNASYGPMYDDTVYDSQPYHELDTDAEFHALMGAARADMVIVFAAGNDGVSQPIIGKDPTGPGFYPFIRPENYHLGKYTFFGPDPYAPDPSNPDFIKTDGSGFDYSGLQPHLIAVVNLAQDGKLAPSSNQCGVAADWCITAPGTNIISTYPTQGADPPYLEMTGTSMATPHVAGAAAVLREVFPFMTAPNIVQTLLSTAKPLGDRAIYGWGLLDLGKAINGPAYFTQDFIVNTQGHNTVFTNDIAGAGGLYKSGLGTLSLTGDNRYQGGTYIYSGILDVTGRLASTVQIAQVARLQGTGYFAAPIYIAGELKPGQYGQTMTVNNTVTMLPGSRLLVDTTTSQAIAEQKSSVTTATKTASSPQQARAATASSMLIPRLQLTGDQGVFKADGSLVVGGTGAPVLGQGIRVVSTSQEIQGSFKDLIHVNQAAGYRWDTVYSKQNLDLFVTPQYYANLSRLGIQINTNQSMVGRALDGVRPAAAARPQANAQDFWDGLYRLSAQALPDALSSLSGQAYSNALLSNLAAQRLVTRTIDHHLVGDTLLIRDGHYATKTSTDRNYDVWGSLLYQKGDYDRDSFASGFKDRSSGLVLGVDRHINAQSRLGLSASFLRSKTTGLNGTADKADTDSYGLNFYGQTAMGNFQARGTLGIAYNSTDVRRSMQIGSWSAQTKGKTRGYDMMASAMLGYQLGSDSLSLVPEVGLRYNHLSRRATQEHGDALSALNVKHHRLNSLETLVGARMSARLSTDVDSSARLNLGVYWAHEHMDRQAHTSTHLMGTQIKTHSPRLGRDALVVDLGVQYAVSKQLSLGLSYGGEYRSGAKQHAANASLRYTW